MVADVFSHDNFEALRPKMTKIVEQCLEDFIAAGDPPLLSDHTLPYILKYIVKLHSYEHRRKLTLRSGEGSVITTRNGQSVNYMKKHKQTTINLLQYHMLLQYQQYVTLLVGLLTPSHCIPLLCVCSHLMYNGS
jgi:hypothetical protein